MIDIVLAYHFPTATNDDYDDASRTWCLLKSAVLCYSLIPFALDNN